MPSFDTLEPISVTAYVYAGSIRFSASDRLDTVVEVRPRDPKKDLDMASYSITKTIKDRPDDPRSDWHWEPKEAFHALARRYAGRAH